MPLPFFGKKTKDTNKFLTLTINSDAVRCLAFYRDSTSVDGRELKIIGSHKQHLDVGKVRAGNIVATQETIEAIQEAVAKTVEEIEDPTTEVIVGVSGDLCLGLMTTIRAKRNKPTPITKQEVKELYQKIAESSQMQAQNEIMQITARTDTDFESITTSNVFTKLDGQSIEHIDGRTGYVMETAVFNAYVPTYHLGNVATVCKKAGLQIKAVGSGMYCLSQAIIKSGRDLSDFIVIEIDGDYTSVGIIFGKGIVSTRTLNIGYHHFVEGISERMGLTLGESERVLKSYINQKLSPSENAIVQNCLRNTLDIWITGLQLLFQEFTGVKTFASKIFITGEGTSIPELWTLITTTKWTNTIPFKSAPEFNRFSFMDLQKISDSTGQINSSEWIPTAVLSQIFLELGGTHD